MERRRIGQSDLFASVLGLGCNNFGWRTDATESAAIIHAALDCGVDFFDTADVYGRHGGSEAILGASLGPRRNEVLIATKFGAPMSRDGSLSGASPAYTVAALEASLRRLGTDRIDLYQLHWPDPATPIGDTLEALQRQVDAGKIRAIGCCNLEAAAIGEAAHFAVDKDSVGFASAQAELSLLVPDARETLLPTLKRLGQSLIPYFPLASGLLTGKYRLGNNAAWRLAGSARHAERFLTPERLQRIEELLAESEILGVELTAMALGWLANQDGVASIIAGASNPAQVRANAAALERGSLLPFSSLRKLVPGVR